MWSTSKARRGAENPAARSRARRAAPWLALAALGLLAAGCLTGHADSDQPWATREPWEGTIPLPSGMLRD